MICETILLHIIIAKGPDINTKLEVREQAAALTELVSGATERCINFIPHRIRIVPLPVERNLVGGVAQTYAKLKLYSVRRGWVRKKKWVTTWRVPAALDGNGGKWSYGFANGVCTVDRYPFTVSTGFHSSKEGLSRIVHSLMTFLHETLHIIGAKHEPVEGSVMHPAALHYLATFGRLVITGNTVRQINNCLSGRKI